MVGLDLTHQAVLPEAVLAEISALGTGLGRMVTDLLGSYGDRYREVTGRLAPIRCCAPRGLRDRRT